MSSTTVVVGAAGGIGGAIARRLAKEGDTDRLILADLRACGKDLTEELRDSGLRVDPVIVDVGDPAQAAALVAAAPDADRLVLGAGAFVSAAALEIGPDEFRHAVAVNYLGPFFVAQGFAQQMMSRRHGAIVAIGSISGRMPRMRQAAYGSGKAALVHALRILGMEIAASGVRVNFVSPGATDTAMIQAMAADNPMVGGDLTAGSLEAMRPRIPTGRIATVDQIAASVAFLLSPESAQINLHDLVVDGGELLGM